MNHPQIKTAPTPQALRPRAKAAPRPLLLVSALLIVFTVFLFLELTSQHSQSTHKAEQARVENAVTSSTRSLSGALKPPTLASSSAPSNAASNAQAAKDQPPSLANDDPGADEFKRALFRSLIQASQYQVRWGGGARLELQGQEYKQLEYTTSDGGIATQWFNPDHLLTTEEIVQGDEGKLLRRWYEPQTQRLVKVLIQSGNTTGTIEFDEQSKPKTFSILKDSEQWTYDQETIVRSSLQ